MRRGPAIPFPEVRDVPRRQRAILVPEDDERRHEGPRALSRAFHRLEDRPRLPFGVSAGLGDGTPREGLPQDEGCSGRTVVRAEIIYKKIASERSEMKQRQALDKTPAIHCFIPV